MPVRQTRSRCNPLVVAPYYRICELTCRPLPTPARFLSTYVPAADYAEALVQAGLDAGFAGLIAQWDVDASNGALFSEDKTLEKLLSRQTADLSVAVKQAL